MNTQPKNNNSQKQIIIFLCKLKLKTFDVQRVTMDQNHMVKINVKTNSQTDPHFNHAVLSSSADHHYLQKED